MEDEPGAAGGADALMPARRHSRRLVVVVAAVIVVGAVAVAAARHQAGSPTPLTQTLHGGRAPDFALPDLRHPSATVALAQFRGAPVVVNFWASWCVPCRQEMPAFERVWESVRGRVAFVGVNHQDRRRDALDLLHETGVRYPVGYDPDGTTATAYGLFGMPTTVFVSADGRLLARHTGQMSEADLRAALDNLFPPR